MQQFFFIAFRSSGKSTILFWIGAKNPKKDNNQFYFHLLSLLSMFPSMTLECSIMYYLLLVFARQYYIAVVYKIQIQSKIYIYRPFSPHFCLFLGQLHTIITLQKIEAFAHPKCSRRAISFLMSISIMTSNSQSEQIFLLLSS